jgi:hypothetical protein
MSWKPSGTQHLVMQVGHRSSALVKPTQQQVNLQQHTAGQHNSTIGWIGDSSTDCPTCSHQQRRAQYTYLWAAQHDSTVKQQHHPSCTVRSSPIKTMEQSIS